MKMALLTTLLLCSCAGSPQGQTGTCQQSGQRGDQPSPEDAECAITTFVDEMATWTIDDLKAAAPGITDPGKYDVMLASLQTPEYQAVPVQTSDGGMQIKVHRVQAWPLLNGDGRAAAAARLGAQATPQAITLEKNRYAAEQIKAGQVRHQDFPPVDVTFRWEGQWKVEPTIKLIGSLTQP